MGRGESNVPMESSTSTSSSVSFDLKGFEDVCEKVYLCQGTEERVAAEAEIRAFVEAPGYIPKCRYVLEMSNSPYAQISTVSGMKTLITDNHNNIDAAERHDLKNYLLSYLFNRHSLQPFVITELIDLICRMMKLGWFDQLHGEHVFRSVIENANQFLRGSPRQWVIGIRILGALTGDMNMSSTRLPTSQRKAAVSFRDLILFDIFQLAIDTLKRTQSGDLCVTDNADREAFLVSLLELVRSCLSYDFLGTSPESSSDDVSTAQLPASWRPAMLDRQTLPLFFDLYMTSCSSSPRIAATTMECLVLVISVRRSFFNDKERPRYLNEVIVCVISVLKSQSGLNNISCYHEFCRLLARLKVHFQLGELVSVNDYEEFIRLVSDFSVQSLKAWGWSPNSVYYLLSLWQRMVLSTPYVKASKPHLLDIYAPPVMEAYVRTNVTNVARILSDGSEDPLDDAEALTTQLEQLQFVGRAHYQKTCAVLVELFDPVATAYQHSVTEISQFNRPVNETTLAIQEGQLAWLVYIIGAVIGGRITVQTQAQHDIMDGELACRALQLMHCREAIQPQICAGHSEHLDLAIIAFLHSFRLIYIGDAGQKSSEIFTCLNERLGLADQASLLSVFVTKIATNLKFGARNNTVITQSLRLFHDLTIGYSCIRMLVKLDMIQFILRNHTHEQFPFLDVDTNTRHRTTFYACLGRLLLITQGDMEDIFELFMQPIRVKLDGIKVAMAQSDHVYVNDQDVMRSVIGVCRDLIGILQACTKKELYMLLFNFLYPDYFDVLVRALEVWSTVPRVTTPILKLVVNMVKNECQRINFDVSSSNGILLFREASRVIVSYGRCIYALPPLSTTDLLSSGNRGYAERYKGISLCFQILRYSLSGGYCNFGVFSLYNDPALHDALDMYMNLLLTIPRDELLAYPKVFKAHYSLLEVISSDHMSTLANLDQGIFAYILSSIGAGLRSVDASIVSQCCATLDNILSYYFKAVQRYNNKGGAVPPIARQFNVTGDVSDAGQTADILHQVLLYLFSVIMYDDCQTQWSISRPLLVLILIQEASFSKFMAAVSGGVQNERHDAITKCFDDLMVDIDQSLSAKNRDKFTQNLVTFRRDINNACSNATIQRQWSHSDSPASLNTMM